MKTNPRRSEDNTTLTISLPKSLKNRLQTAASADSRKISPWCVLQLEKVVDRLESQTPQPMITALPDPGDAGENAGAK
jgi:hypothetical protein